MCTRKNQDFRLYTGDIGPDVVFLSLEALIRASRAIFRRTAPAVSLTAFVLPRFF